MEDKISVEVTPHHLFFEQKDIEDGDVKMKCNPPIRADNERYYLIHSLKKKYFDSISSASQAP